MTTADVITWMLSTTPIIRGDLVYSAVAVAWAGVFWLEKSRDEKSRFWALIFGYLWVVCWIWAVRLASKAIAP